VKIRLRRIGAKKQPAYRIVVADARAPRDGRFIDVVGHYNPLASPATVVVDNERAVQWLRNGAQPTDIVVRLFKQSGAWSQYTGELMPEAPSSAEAPVLVEAPAPVAEAPDETAPVEEAPAVDADAAPAALAETAPDAAPADETA